MSTKYTRAITEIRPQNDNPRASVTGVEYVRGASQAFLSIDELVDFHPDKMNFGMQVSIINYPGAGDVSDYYLKTAPNLLKDANNDSIITKENFTEYWQLKSTKSNEGDRVFEYAPDKSGGGKPSFPYTTSTEATDNWTPVYDATTHRWVRWRTDDVDDNSDGVYDNWTPPLAIKESFTEGDYIQNRFKRQAVSTTVFSSTSGMGTSKYYLVKTGSVTKDGVTYSRGKTFLYESGDSLTFNSATVIEWLQTPPFTKSDGTLNNLPTGWSDTPPEGSDQLWMIEAQKSAYGQLKSSWRIKQIPEDPQYVRYSDSPTPLPSTICGTGDTAASGTAKDTALNTAGWVSDYSDQSYIATREDDNGGSAGPPFTEWVIDKIKEESGEYTDYVFKLFDVNLDPDAPEIVKPTLANPASEGYFDTPQPTTSTKINYVFSARKFINGELKTPWSAGIPWNGESVINAIISADNGKEFKIDKAGTTVPTQIQLTAKLYKGVIKLWEKSDVSLSFTWKQVYDDGSAVDVAATANAGADFYYLGSSGTAGTSGYLYSGQRLLIKPAGVTGKATFRVTITVSMDDADDLIYTDEVSVVDITDGKDAKDLTVRADSQRTVYDTSNTVFVPTTLRLNAYQSNLGSPTYYWYKWNGASWDALSTGSGYTVNAGSLIIAAGTVFTADGSAEEIRIALSTHDTNPESADFESTFSDYMTVAKLGSAGVGSPGADAIAVLLDNEASTMVLDKATGSPISGETGNTGRNITGLQLWDGNTKKVYGGANDYTVAVSPNSGDIQFAVEADGDDANIYIDQWNSTSARSATCTITITYGSLTFTKKFQIATTLDAAGAFFIRMISDKGFAFTPTNRGNKTLTAQFHDADKSPSLQASGYEYRWKIAGVWTSWTTTATQTLTRANILGSDTVTLEVGIDGELSALLSITEIFSDLTDAAVIRMMTDAASVDGDNKIPTSHTSSSDIRVPDEEGGATWKSAFDAYWLTNKPTFACDGYEDPTDITKYIWSEPYRISGEKGDQGPNGDFYFKMYKADGTSLPNGSTSTLAQMTAAGWKSPEQRPTSGDIYETERRWNGEGVSFTNGYPDTDPSSGSEWSTPVKITGDTPADGNDGNDGTDGNDGWTPKFAVVTSGEKRHLQLTDWFGGGGTKPGFIGQYVGASGFVSSIGSAVDIRGEAGADGLVKDFWHNTSGPAYLTDSANLKNSVSSSESVESVSVDIGTDHNDADRFEIIASGNILGKKRMAIASTATNTINTAARIVALTHEDFDGNHTMMVTASWATGLNRNRYIHVAFNGGDRPRIIVKKLS